MFWVEIGRSRINDNDVAERILNRMANIWNTMSLYHLKFRGLCVLSHICTRAL